MAAEVILRVRFHIPLAFAPWAMSCILVPPLPMENLTMLRCFVQKTTFVCNLLQAREVYRPVAAEASLMYFMLLKLSSVDFMYQYSLDSFTR